MPALQRFFDAERKRRAWSMRELAKRAQISLSKAYAISNGDDNVEFETFENIATAFHMSPAELAVAIGKGPAAENPERVALHAMVRDVADADVSIVERWLRPFIGSPRSMPVEPTNRRRRATDVTDHPEDLDSSNHHGIQQALPRKRHQSQSLATQKAAWGFQPAY